ncbi:hypothetical protein F5Y04DRAFT_241598 [Hypomontagnella monticulosa]|nr:hypothetical protein F5Y04DRAFT_241598 [Hypomontagnella monticulosa]
MTDLSPLDRLMPRGYIRQMLCFPSTHTDVPRLLRTGLAGLMNDVPYLLSGLIISEDNKKISLSEAYQSLDDLLSEKDLSDVLNYAVMRGQNFPPSAFIAPGIIPPDTQPPYPEPPPVFRARLSLVKGGFILCVAVHHCTTDITGFGTLLKIWASHCRIGASTATGLDSSSLDHGVLLKRAKGSDKTTPTSIPKLLHVRGPEDFTRLARLASSASSSSDLVTGIFFFQQKTLLALKRLVNEHIITENATGWVSSGDVLTALLWSATLVAEGGPSTPRPGRMANVEATSTIGFPVNFRSRFHPPLSPNYLGAAFVMTAATASREDLLSFARGTGPPSGGELLDHTSISKLGKIASVIRTSLHGIDEGSVRDVLTYLDKASDDHPPITLGPRHDGISIVSWADQDAYGLDWGDVIGKCDSVRLPKLMYKRYPIVLPRITAGVNGEDGGLEVIVSFDRRILERFERSWPINRFATLRCYC